MISYEFLEPLGNIFLLRDLNPQDIQENQDFLLFFMVIINTTFAFLLWILSAVCNVTKFIYYILYLEK